MSNKVRPTQESWDKYVKQYKPTFSRPIFDWNNLCLSFNRQVVEHMWFPFVRWNVDELEEASDD